MDNPFVKKDEAITDHSKVVSDIGSSANVKLTESIKRNMEFNARLEMERSGRSAVEIESPIIKKIKNLQLLRIEQVLKDKGMDSQQRLQSMERIKEILEEA